MRVLHVTPCYPPTWAYGGIPRVVHALACAQRARGMNVRVWTTDAFDATSRAPVPAQRDDCGVEIHVTRLVSNRLAWTHQLYLPTGPAPLENVDIVHLHGHRHLLNWSAFREARKRGIPVVHTPNGTAPRLERKVFVKRVWDRVFDGHVPLEADRVVAVSKAEVRQLLALGVAGDRIVRIPNPLHLAEFAELPKRGTFRAAHGLGEGPVVAYLGQITPRKGVDRLVTAFGSGIEGATLVVAGAARGMELPTAPHVRYTGTLEGPDRLALLVDADVLVYPSSDEIFGLVPLEGLLCGVPVVVGGDCGCGELIGEAGAGLLTRSLDAAELRGHIQTMLTDRERATGMVERGRRYIEAHLNPASVAGAHATMYEALTA